MGNFTKTPGENPQFSVPHRQLLPCQKSECELRSAKEGVRLVWSSTNATSRGRLTKFFTGTATFHSHQRAVGPPLLCCRCPPDSQMISSSLDRPLLCSPLYLSHEPHYFASPLGPHRRLLSSTLSSCPQPFPPVRNLFLLSATISYCLQPFPPVCNPLLLSATLSSPHCRLDYLTTRTFKTKLKFWSNVVNENVALF